MGMTRLSIIDLETGDPPISNEDGSVWVVFNREIYNYAERRTCLVTAGHEFKTHTDTEVIVHEYEERGPACVDQFRGMFSFAIWDTTRGHLLLARDRYGIKPLYVAARDGCLAFASEIKALLEVPWVDRSWDATALSAYLRLGYAPGVRTAYSGIRKLAPGTTELWTWDPVGGARPESSRTYWKPSGEEMKPEPSFDEAARQVHRYLRESVRVRLRSDVPLGAFLSGGIDSSTVIAMMRQEGVDDLLTFSIGFEEQAFDELPYAGLVAKHFRLAAYDLCALAPPAILKVAGALGARIIPQGKRGGDFLRKLGTDRSLWHLDAIGPAMPEFCQAALSTSFREFLRVQTEPLALERLFASDGTPQAALITDQQTYLRDDILTKVDRMSMAVSLEVRVPLLDHLLAEYVNGLPFSYKMNLHRSKRILRHVVRDKLPPQVLKRRKVGFVPPLRSWLRGPLREWSREVLFCNCPTVFDEKGLGRALAILENDTRDCSNNIWVLLGLGVWARTEDPDQFLR